MDRRTILKGGLVFAATAHTAVASSERTHGDPKSSAKERFDFHLSELKRAAEELDPKIGHWTICDFNQDSAGGCSLIVSAFRVTGRYEGDGMYEAGKQTWNGDRVEWRVKLLSGRVDGERMFDVSCPGEKRMHLIESRLNTFIGRRLS